MDETTPRCQYLPPTSLPISHQRVSSQVLTNIDSQIMSEDPAACLSAMSLHLSRTLDEIGLNSLTVKRRRKTHLVREQMWTWEKRLNGDNVAIYHFGSQTEGATTPGLGSDIDMLICLDVINVIQGLTEWKQGKENCLMLHEDTAPGYCRLQWLRSDKPVAREDLPNKHCTFDNDTVILKNTVMHSTKTGERNGPAMSASGRHALKDNDIVGAYKCNSWPAQAEEFIRRRRRHGWPSEQLLQEVTQHGVFLVGVGHKLSPTEPLEWRISASMAERCLMFSLTVVHLKCYVLLKMLVKTFVEPRVEKCISSYHCKTALLHCTENTKADFWRDDNLIQCVLRCLEILLTWVTDGRCPHFILNEENLFDGKVTVHNRDTLQSILTDLLERNGHAFLQINIDDLGQKLQTKLNTEPSVVPVLDSPATVVLIENIEFSLHELLNCRSKQIILAHISEEPVSLINYVYRSFCLLKDRIEQSDKHERQAIQILTDFISCWLGSLLASDALSQNSRIPEVLFQMFPNEPNINIASTLKLASLLCCNGDLREVETLLGSVEVHLSRNIPMALCRCYDAVIQVSASFCQAVYETKGKKERAKFYAHCVIFSPQEIYCAPPALWAELHRSVGDDVQHRDHQKDDWMDWAAVDCIPYLFYLQYLIFRQLRKQDLQNQSLHKLDWCVRQDLGFCHLETAWNLLGQCYEFELKPVAAMTCYMTSLRIRPRNNAAKWHIAILCYRLIQHNI